MIEKINIKRLSKMQSLAVELSLRYGTITADLLEYWYYGRDKIEESKKERLPRIAGCYRCLRSLVKKKALKQKGASFRLFTKSEALKLVRARRRYYLHQKIKKALTYSAYDMEVDISDSVLRKLTPTDIKYLEELKDKFGYNIQYKLEYDGQSKKSSSDAETSA